MLEVVLAKPVDKNEYMRYTRGAGRGTATNFPSQVDQLSCQLEQFSLDENGHTMVTVKQKPSENSTILEFGVPFCSVFFLYVLVKMF